MPPSRRTPSHTARARAAPYTPPRPAYRPPAASTSTSSASTTNSKKETPPRCEPFIPTYQKGEDVGKATKAMYMKMLPAWGDNEAFESGLNMLDIPFKKHFHDKADKHFLVSVFSPELRDKMVAIGDSLPNTEFPQFDKMIFNENALDRQVRG